MNAILKSDVHLDIRHVDGDNWMLLAPIEVSWNGVEFTVRRGFITDLASIPRALRWLIPRGRNESIAAVIHDWIYRGYLKDEFTRKQADQMFLDIMEECGVSWLRRHAIHKGVRVGGAWSWNGYRTMAHPTEAELFETEGLAKAQAKHEELAQAGRLALVGAGWRVLESKTVRSSAQSFDVVELVIRRAQVVHIVRWHPINKGWFEADGRHGNGIFQAGTA